MVSSACFAIIHVCGKVGGDVDKIDDELIVVQDGCWVHGGSLYFSLSTFAYA